MYGMFQKSRFNQPLNKWKDKIGNNVEGNIINMSWMFAYTDFDQDISEWNVSKVKDMSWMFYGSAQFNQDLSGWDA